MINTQHLADQLFKALTAVEGVLSVSLVGSVTEQENLTETSDIDTIVIVSKITKSLFETCIQTVRALSGEQLGAPERNVHVNPTFGPLKFDDPNTIVVHLMVYDLEGHRTHVLKSPFTCFDWERSTLHAGPSLKEIYPVLRLQPRDLLQARRGIQNYLEDLQAGVISYREYDFSEGVQEVTRRHKLDARHQGEYAYHIMKMLVINFAKTLLNENGKFSPQELYSFWEEHLPGCRGTLPFFKELETLKRQRAQVYPAETMEQTRAFLHAFYEDIQSTWASAVEVDFVRHGRTELNDGSFLGIRRDPPLAHNPVFQPLEKNYDTVFSSPLKRAVQTAQKLQPSADIKKEDRLREQDYGEAEGMTYQELARAFPDMIKAWAEQKDPCFPGGENSRMVQDRIESFMQDIAAEHTLAVSHNVALRGVLGSLLNIPLAQWFNIPVEHLETYSALKLSDRYYPALTLEQKGRITDAICGFQKRLESAG